MPLKDINLENLAKKTEGYAGSDIESVCREAAIFALREDMESKEISIRHFEKAIEKVPPSISKEIEKAYSEMRDALSAARANQMKEEKPVYMG
jgi:transitional endoplasmic reticulum ATPase